MPRTGRPSKLTPEMAARIFYLSRRGLTDKEIAEVLLLSESTLTIWKRDPNFFTFLNKAKDLADSLVERSLYERAMGYDHPEDKVFCTDGVVTTVPTIKHIPPDVTAQIFWLKNRRKADWRDRADVEHGGEVTVNHFLEGALRRAGIGTEVKAEANGHTNGNGRI